LLEMAGTGPLKASSPVPPEIMSALEANQDLRQALQEAGLPTRFSAMVLGLATLRQLGEQGASGHRDVTG
jgi:hypothetical protein